MRSDLQLGSDKALSEGVRGPDKCLVPCEIQSSLLRSIRDEIATRVF